MFGENVVTFRSLPTEQRYRYWTDCCCTIFSALFALLLFIPAILLFNAANITPVLVPVDSNGLQCNISAPSLYFRYPENINEGRYCVRICPKMNQPLQCAGDVRRECAVAGGSNYTTQPFQSTVGTFCAPTNSTLRNHIFHSHQLRQRFAWAAVMNILPLVMLMSVIVGMVWVLLLMCCAKPLTYILYVACFSMLITSGIYLLIHPLEQAYSIVLTTLLLMVAVICLLQLCVQGGQMQLCSIFLHQANSIIHDNIALLLYIPFFLLLTFALLALCCWELIAFATFPSSDLNLLYQDAVVNVIVLLVLLFELLWGIQFLRDAFSFMLSGNGVEWYFRGENNQYSLHCTHPLTRMLSKNWGSVSGGAFLNAFVGWLQMVIGFLGICVCSSCKCEGWWCWQMVGLARTDAYAYINLSGIPFCDAARQCEALCTYSPHFQTSYSCIRTFRFVAHACLVSLVCFISYLILLRYDDIVSVWTVLLIGLVSCCILTYFIGLHTDLAEGLMVCYLVEENCSKGTEMQVCPLSLQHDIYHYGKTYRRT